MKMHERYLQTLVAVNDWITVSDWAQRVGEQFPEVLTAAEEQAANQKNDTTGLRELAARISSCIATGTFGQQIEIDASERPRKIRYLNPSEQESHLNADIEEDAAPLKRSEIISRDEQTLSDYDRYRISEFEGISKHLKMYFGLDFEVDHANALLNPTQPGRHHPDNLQLLLKAHNGKKNADNWQRFSFDEQKNYLLAAIELQALVAPRLGLGMDKSVLDSLLDRLQKVFQDK